MNFQLFLKAASDKNFWQQKRVFCFNGKVCPILFFHFLWTKLSDSNILPFTKKSISADFLKDNIDQILGQSILGMANFYWLGDLSDQGKKDKLVDYIFKYQGPHKIAFFTSNEIKKTELFPGLQVINISQTISMADFDLLLNIFRSKVSPKKLTVVGQIFTEQQELGLDESCMVMNYLELVSVNLVDCLPAYLAQIIGSQPSLNQLSNYFFSRQAKQFFGLWVELESKYPEMFWVTFWADQIWRSFHVIELMNKKDFVKAKQMSYGLPFAFINKTWTSFSRDYLHELYQNLYKIDYSIKKGSTFYSLDLFYLSHFK